MALSDSKQTLRAESKTADPVELSGGRDYSVFGIKVRSRLPLPELFPAAWAGSPDVTIGTCPALNPGEPSRPGFSIIDEAIVIAVPEVGRFTISGGNTILVEPTPDVPDRDLRLYLLGSAFGALLHQRGLLPLHANAVEIDGSAVAFMGESGAGKSTLAAWFHDRGHRIVADDVCAILFDGIGRPIALPGLPRFRLWREALVASKRDAAGLARSFARDDWDKFDVPVDAGTAVSGKLPLGAIYVLKRGDEFQVHRLEGVAAVDAVFTHTYRGKYVAAVGKGRSHWDACIRLARETPIFSVTRPWSLDRLDETSERVLEDARAQLADVGVPELGPPQARPRTDTAPCVGCGLCCDGTIFDHAVVTPGEQTRLLDHGMELATRGDRTVFLLPCRYAQCGKCSNYEDRFDICHSFRCDLLKRYHRGEIGLAEARAMVEKAVKLVAAVKADGPAAALYRERRRHRSQLAGQMMAVSGEERRTLGRRLLNMVALDEFLDSRFRHKKKTAGWDNERAESRTA